MYNEISIAHFVKIGKLPAVLPRSEMVEPIDVIGKQCS